MNISKETIARTVVLAIALLNQILTTLGKNPLPFSDDTIYEVVTLLVTAASAIWAYWKNNSLTQNAIKADHYLAELKKADKEQEEA